MQRIKEAQTWTAANLNANNSWTGAIGTTAHYSSYQFDLNGNITHLTRRGNSAVIDDLAYNYYGASSGLPNTLNKLANVQDTPGTTNDFSDDINPSQNIANYDYDAIGRLTKDMQENITSITWNAQNKVTKIARLAISDKSDVEFKYDAMGRRIAKIVSPRVSGVIDNANITTTYYALDAQGNVMATYTQKGQTPTSTTLNEFAIYGASRLGTQSVGVPAMAGTPNFGYVTPDGETPSAIIELKNTTFNNNDQVQYKIGSLVLNSTVQLWNTGNTIHQNAAGLMAKINANTVTTDVTASLWYSNNASGTVYMKLSYGQQGNWQVGKLGCYLNGSATESSLSAHRPQRALGYGTAKGNDIVGAKRYELSNHLGNVLAVISDRKWGVDDGVYNLTTGAKTSSTQDGITDYYISSVVAFTDYDPYGTEQEGRKGGDPTYRFGYQGSEKDNEVKGEGNSYATQNRMLDPRIGRWFSTDPVPDPSSSPYNSMDNNPVLHNDQLGLYTEKRAERVAARARRLGADEVNIYKTTVGKKTEWQVNVIKKDAAGRQFEGNFIHGNLNSKKDFNSLQYVDYSSHASHDDFSARFTYGDQVNYAAEVGKREAAIQARWDYHRANAAAAGKISAAVLSLGFGLALGVPALISASSYLAAPVTIVGSSGMLTTTTQFGAMATGTGAATGTFVTAKLLPGLASGGSNLLGQYMTTGNFTDIDYVGPAVSTISGMATSNPFAWGMGAESVDAAFDVYGNGKTRVALQNKSAKLIMNDLYWGAFGTVAGTKLDKVGAGTHAPALQYSGTVVMGTSTEYFNNRIENDQLK